MKETIVNVSIVLCILAGLFWLGYLIYNLPMSPSAEQQTETINGQKVIVSDGCQYYKIPSSYGFWAYTHKGNCTNSIHIYK